MRILIADDCPFARIRLKKHLTDWGFQPVIASDGEQALAALTSKFAPRLAILDWMMPKMDGLAVTQKIREEELGPYTYIVMLTAKTDEDDLISAFAAGIDDFLTKPFNEEELHQRLRAGQRILQLQDQLNDMLVQLKFQATHDSLTGLSNRRSILDSLERELNRASRGIETPGSTSVVLLDIDRFKSINDQFGHLAGDAVLKSVGDIIRKSLRSYDYVGRYGGEEFIIILPATARDQTGIIVERIRENIAEKPIHVGDHNVRVTASLGVVTSHDETDIEKLIKVADDAMYHAKSSGRNCCVFADEMPQPEMCID
jgi:diguanylate cyclase (GGDEF)-like protein